MPSLVIRADASPAVGAGHAMRCATLAEAWTMSGSGDAIVWGEISLDFVRSRLLGIGAEIVKPGDSVPHQGAIVCDHYDPDVRAGIAGKRQFDLRVLVDDLGGAVDRGFDAVWNPNAYGSAEIYPGFGGRVLAGPKFIPVRDDIPRWTGASTAGTAVMLGGGKNIPAQLEHALADLSNDPSLRPLAGIGSWLPDGWTELDAADPWPGIVRCERLVTASGTATWEAAKAGIPVVMVLLAANQSRIFDWAIANGAPGVEIAGTNARTLRARLTEAIERAYPLPAIESGAERIRDFIRDAVVGKATSSPKEFVIRPVTMDDAGLLLRWRNDPETRRASRATAQVTKNEHVEWLAKTLQSPTRKLRIVEQDGRPVGMVRADYEDGVHQLSWSVAPDARGRGVGTRMVAQFTREFAGPIRAVVRKENTSSARIAERAGMRVQREEDGFLYYSRG